MTPDEPPGKSAAPLRIPRAIYRLRVLRRLLVRVEVASPRFAVLRIHLVLAWIAVGSACAAALAPWFVRRIPEFGYPQSYIALWTAISFGASVFWVYLQWRDRPSLPRKQPIGFWWSSLVNSIFIFAICSVSMVAGMAAESELRAMQRVSEVDADIQEFAQLRGEPYYLFSTRAPVPKSPPDSKGAGIVMPTVIASLQQDAFPQDVLLRHAPRELLDEAKACGKAFMFEARYTQYRELCDSAKWRSENRKRAWEQGRDLCEGNALYACGMRKISDVVEYSLQSRKRAHLFMYIYPGSSDPNFILFLIFISVVLGMFASNAGVFSVYMATSTYFTLALVALLISQIVGSFDPVSQRAPLRNMNAWGGVIYVVVITLTVALLARARARSALLDLGVLVAQIWPLFIIVAQWYIDPSPFNVCIEEMKCASAPYTAWPTPHIFPYVIIGWTLFLSFFVSRYRVLPHST